MLRVGCVEYINALPIHFPFQGGHIPCSSAFTFAIPSVLNGLLRENKLDVALSSSVEYLDGNYRLVPGFGIVGLQQVLSVNLYTRLPVNALEGARIGLTHHSAASISLLKVLFRHHWRVAPQLEPLDRKELLTGYDAFLLIGDEALEQLTIPGFQTIDLATAWHEMTGLPFVFAVFSARNEVSFSSLEILQQELDAALAWSSAHREAIEKAAMKQCQMTPELVRNYYTVLGYRLGSQEIESLELFRKLRHNV